MDPDQEESESAQDSFESPEPERTRGGLDVVGRVLVGFSILLFCLAGALTVLTILGVVFANDQGYSGYGTVGLVELSFIAVPVLAIAGLLSFVIGKAMTAK